MKTSLTSVIALLCFITGSAQKISFEYANNHAPVIKKETLKKAERVREFVPALYWDKVEGVTVSISGTQAGKLITASNNSDQLNQAQKDLLLNADLNSDINLKITVPYNDPGHPEAGLKNKDFDYTIVAGPDSDALFPGGEDEMQKYLGDHFYYNLAKISEPGKVKPVTVVFTVNEDGQVSDVFLEEASSSLQVDQLLLITISNMPKWKPAENKGTKVKEKLRITLGTGGC